MHESFEPVSERLRHEHVNTSVILSVVADDMQSDLIVAGLAERTQEAYLRAVRQLSEYYNGTRPADLSELHVEDYLLWLRSEKRAAPGTLRIAIGGLRFYYRQTFPTDWNGAAGIRADTRIVLKYFRVIHAPGPRCRLRNVEKMLTTRPLRSFSRADLPAEKRLRHVPQEKTRSNHAGFMNKRLELGSASI